MRRFLVALALAFSIPAGASTYTVDDLGDAPDFNPGDDVCSTAPVLGACTLRAAIMESNAHAGFDEIAFDVAGTILPGTAYPSITGPVTIEGRSAPGYAGAPVVIVDGAGSVAVGLHFDLGSDESELIALEISGFSTAGVLVDADTLSIRNNYLGPVSGGGPNGDGLQLNGNGSTVGGSDDGGNVISGNDFYGILVTGTNHDIRDNFIGTDAAGTSGLANGEDGISIDGGATGVTIGSETAGEENIISGNFDTGISIDDGSGNTIAGNYIGLDVTGTAAIPNFIGIEVHSAGNTIGTTAAGNVISGNDDDGIDIFASTVVQNNIVGPDATGTVGVGNFGFGIFAFVVSEVQIGGSGPGEGNVISFNGAEGIFFFETDASTIEGNIIGLDAAGANILGNGLEGILVVNSFDVTIAGNTVSGNSFGGIVDAGGIGNIIESNRVGTTADGNAAAGNLGIGIEIFASLDAIVRSNVVSANDGHGIEVVLGSFGTLIHSNIIGLGADLTTELGNLGDGVNVCDGAEGTVVGSVAHGGNTITGNGENGIGVEPTALENNSWGANSIYGNELLGIDIERDGVTPNDEDDPDTGANNLQNFPELDSAVTTGTASFVRGTLNTLPSTSFRIHFYSSPAADPSGFGEGQTWLGFLNGTTDANGDASFLFTGPALTAGHVVTATATTGDGTSEFSAAETVANAPTISFSSATYMESEVGVTATITVTRSGNLDVVSTVGFTTSNDTAIAGSDYTATSGTLTFASGDATETFTVAITNDATDEPSEVVDLTLSNPTSAGLAAPFTAELSIADDDDPPSIDIDDVSQAEDGGSFAFTVTLSGPSALDVTVGYATADDTVIAGSDYTAQSGTVTIDAGDTTATITVPMTADAIFEDDETFFVDLSNPTNAFIDDGQGLGTIENDDPMPALSIDDVVETEGNDIVFTVTLSAAAGVDVTFDFDTTNDTATAGDDYTGQSSSGTIPAGSLSTTIIVPTASDALFELDETFLVTLSGAGNATVADDQGTGTIENDDPMPGITIGDASIAEGENLVFTVTLSTVAGVDVTVNFETADDTANAASDYTAQSRAATIPAGSLSTTITVPTIEDTDPESDETLFVDLTGATNGAIADSQATGTIENDDGVPSITIDDVSGPEGTSLVFTITLSAPAPDDVTVDFATADGTANDFDDYTPQSGTATILKGNTSTTVSVPAREDAPFESDETFFVNLSNATNAAIADDEGIGTIEEDETAPTISITNVTLNEGFVFHFNVSIDGPISEDVTVDFTTADGSTNAGADYTAQSGTLVIPAGSTFATISVPTSEGPLFDGTENFFVNLSNPTNAMFGDNQAVGTILDNQPMPGVAIFDVWVEEGVNFLFRLSLSAESEDDVTVDFTTADGTAIAGADYTPLSGTVTFPAGTTTATIMVTTLEDTVAEGDEAFRVELSNAVNADATGEGATGTIDDDDAGLPALFINDVAEHEGETLVFTITLMQPATDDILVAFTTVPGSATTPDFDHTTAHALIGAGETTGTIAVSTNNDVLAEGNEEFFVHISDADGAVIVDNEGSGTILDGEEQVLVTISPFASAQEGNSPGTSQDVTFTLTLSTASDVDVEVDYSTRDITAIAGSDYVAETGTVIIPAGQLSRTLTVSTIGDLRVEPDEIFAVDITEVRNASQGSTSGQGTILNDDSRPTLDIGDVTLDEGDSGPTLFVFPITLSHATGDPVTVTFTTLDQTAVAPGDYIAQSGSFIIPPGETSASITIEVIGDTTPEPDESFFVNVEETPFAFVDKRLGEGRIVNDDPALTEADLSISKTTTATTFTPGQQITYTLTVENAGPLAAADITVTDVLPPGLSLVSASGDGAVCTGTTTVTCTLAALAADGTAVITLVTVASGTEPITNTATVSAAAPDDTATANNSAFAVIAPAAVSAPGIPTLSEWALLVLAAMLAFVAVRRT